MGACCESRGSGPWCSMSGECGGRWAGKKASGRMRRESGGAERRGCG